MIGTNPKSFQVRLSATGSLVNSRDGVPREPRKNRTSIFHGEIEDTASKQGCVAEKLLHDPLGQETPRWLPGMVNPLNAPTIHSTMGVVALVPAADNITGTLNGDQRCCWNCTWVWCFFRNTSDPPRQRLHKKTTRTSRCTVSAPCSDCQVKRDLLRGARTALLWD